MKRRELSVRWKVGETVETGSYLKAVRGPRDLVDYLAPWAHDLQETFIVLFMNARMKLIGHKEIGRGSSISCPVDPQAVFRAALLANAQAIVLAHNHPSGDTSPSDEDVQVTNNLVMAGKMLNIAVLDHLIVGLNDDGKVIHASLRERGMV
jgi:DNA repair protein RadC